MLGNHSYNQITTSFCFLFCVILFNYAYESPTLTTNRETPTVSIKSNNDNPYPEWCPDAVCTERPLCQPCKRRYLFILAQGRSGSSTVKNMLNYLPGVRIRGEFAKKTNYLSDMATSLTNVKLVERDDNLNPFDSYSENHLLCSSQAFIQGKVTLLLF